MAKRKRNTTTLLEQITDLDNPSPQDFDPEGEFDGPTLDSGHASNDVQRREHYLDVGRRKLRNPDPVEVGPRYAGSSIKRQDLSEEAVKSHESDHNPFDQSRQNKDHQSDVSTQSSRDSTAEEIVDPDQVSEIDLSNPEIEDDHEIDSDNAFEHGDHERFKPFSFGDGTGSQVVTQGSTKTHGTHFVAGGGTSLPYQDGDRRISSFGALKAIPPSSSFENERSGTESEGDTSSSDTSESPVLSRATAADRTSLRKLMASGQQSVVTNLSREAAADISKGKAVAQQQRTFSALLNCRIRLQKALTMARDMKTPPTFPVGAPSESAAITESAQLAALSLWNSLDSLRTSLHMDKVSTSKAQDTGSSKVSTPRSALLSRMQLHENLSRDAHRANLSKWSTKTMSPSALPSRNKFSATTSQVPFLSVLDAHLCGSNISSQLSKSYTVDDSSDKRSKSYDDTSLYATLLRDLVSQDSFSASLPDTGPMPRARLTLSDSLPKPKKQHRANLDTRASKGRKMRYTVHEKLQNFMPREDRGTWGDRQVAELFSGLLGQKVRGGLEEADDDESPAGMTEESEDDFEPDNGHGDGFRLFKT